jgi:hypothetical protein
MLASPSEALAKEGYWMLDGDAGWGCWNIEHPESSIWHPAFILINRIQIILLFLVPFILVTP